jgi:hypothetical protein
MVKLHPSYEFKSLFPLHLTPGFDWGFLLSQPLCSTPAPRRAHHRRRVVHFNVTAHPTAEWTARQVIQACPEETAPQFLVRDRDGIYGERFRRAIEILGIEEVVTAARSPWQNPYAERVIGSLRRDCLDHVIVLDEVHLQRILARYFEYHNETRCHLSLAGDASEPRGVQGPELGKVVEFPKVGGLHHRYERAA